MIFETAKGLEKTRSLIGWIGRNGSKLRCPNILIDWHEDQQDDLVEFSTFWFPIARHLADHVAFLQASLSIFLQTSCLPQCLGYQSCWYATWHTTRMSAKPKKTYPTCLACDDMLERTSTTCCPKWSVWYKQHYSILKLGGQTLLIFISHGLRFAFRTHQKYPHFRAIDWFWQYVGLALCWQEKCKSI